MRSNKFKKTNAQPYKYTSFRYFWKYAWEKEKNKVQINYFFMIKMVSLLIAAKIGNMERENCPQAVKILNRNNKNASCR